jgi:RimJ/RimL family protein N-acetyltransferase
MDEGRTAFWPLFGLVIPTPRLELRLLREDDLPGLVELVDSGIHDRGTMPFFVPWTDAEPLRRARDVAQWMWRHRANWSPDNWTLTSGVFVHGRLVGVQDLGAEHFRAVRSVETGSWLGRAHQGQGIGREMREAILHLAFAGLGAQEALSGAFEDNVASLATSRSVGYEENGEARGHRRDGSARTVRFRLGSPHLGAAPPPRHRDPRPRGVPRHVRRSSGLTPPHPLHPVVPARARLGWLASLAPTARDARPDLIVGGARLARRCAGCRGGLGSQRAGSGAGVGPSTSRASTTPP